MSKIFNMYVKLECDWQPDDASATDALVVNEFFPFFSESTIAVFAVVLFVQSVLLVGTPVCLPIELV